MTLREYIDKLEAAGELQRISTEVDTHFEITEITDRVSKMEGGGKALLFERVKGSSYPVLMNMMGSDRRMAMALGVDSLDDISRRIDKLLKEAMSPKNTLMDKLRMLPLLQDVAKWFPRKSSSRGECQEVVWQGDEVDLRKLPILTSWPYDGGPFITLPMVCTLDPETGIPNMGMYRMQIFDSKTTGMHWHRHKTGARHYDGYKRLGKRMPVSVAIGGDPAYIYSATAPMPDNMDEMLLAGMLRQKPVKLVKCLTNDIYVPADCDFVLEGYVDPAEELTVEGPFGDHTGFYSLSDLYPKFHVVAITSRRDAVYPATIVGVPPMEDAYIAKATERIFLAPIRLAVQPEVRDLYMPMEGTAHNLAIVSIAKRYLGQPQKVAQGLWGAGQMMFNKYLVITPEDTDIRSREEMFRLLRHFDPERHMIHSEGILDVLDHSAPERGYGAKLAIDLTDIDPEATPRELKEPCTATPCGGVELFNTELFKELGLVILYAEREWREKIDVKEYLDTNHIEARFVVLFDHGAAGHMTIGDLLWIAAANTDPKRDIEVYGSTLIIDARSKRPGYGNNPDRFPNAVTSSTETIRLVNERWAEYGLGEKIESPSRRYRKLWLSDSAEW
ncbi:MAG: menaquinone biosynthesis decarboxylase [Alistipes sp.]|nr:menaquinone biosynthesis decarboxylase [Alistipes sp.]